MMKRSIYSANIHDDIKTIKFISLLVMDIMHDADVAITRRELIRKILVIVFKSISIHNIGKMADYYNIMHKCLENIMNPSFLTNLERESVVRPYKQNDDHLYVLDNCVDKSVCRRMLKYTNIVIDDTTLYDRGSGKHLKCDVVDAYIVSNKPNASTILKYDTTELYKSQVAKYKNNMVEYDICKKSDNYSNSVSTRYNINGVLNGKVVKIHSCDFHNNWTFNFSGYHLYRGVIFKSLNLHPEYRHKSNTAKVSKKIVELLNRYSLEQIRKFPDSEIEMIYLELMAKFWGDFGQIMFSKFNSGVLYDNKLYNITNDNLYKTIGCFIGVNTLFINNGSIYHHISKESNVNLVY